MHHSEPRFTVVDTNGPIPEPELNPILISVSFLNIPLTHNRRVPLFCAPKSC